MSPEVAHRDMVRRRMMVVANGAKRTCREALWRGRVAPCQSNRSVDLNCRARASSNARSIRKPVSVAGSSASACSRCCRST